MRKSQSLGSQAFRIRGILFAAVLFTFSTAGSQAQTVVAWGDNSQGQCTIPDSATNVVAVAAGMYHSVALTAGGEVLVWGSSLPAPLGLTNVTSIAAGANHCLALRGDGRVVAWGQNSYGATNVPASATNVLAIAAGDNHSLALRLPATA